MRRSVGFLALLVACVGCGGGTTTPAAPSPAAPVLRASVRAVGALSFSPCTTLLGCTFQGGVINDGPDCATNVRGVTHLFGASGAEIEQRQWTIVLFRLRAAEQALYNDCCFTNASATAQRSYRTDVFFDAVKC